MNKIIAAISVFFLCAVSFAVGHVLAMRSAKAMILDNLEMISIWRQSDWGLNSIRYAQIIQLIQSEQYTGATQQACKAMAYEIKRAREIHRAVGESNNSGPRVPAISEKTYAKSCK